MAALRDALRERLTVRNALGSAVVLAILWHLSDGATAQFATTVSSMAVAAAGGVLSDAYDVRSSVTHLSFGAYALVSATGLLLFGDGSVAVPLALLAVGGWVVLDVVQTFRHEGASTDDPPDGWDVYLEYVGRRVREALDERPRTRRELFEALDADADDVAAALDRLVERGVVDRAGSEYRIADVESRGAAERTEQVRSALDRIARPVTLELGDDDSEVGTEPRDPDGRTAGPAGSLESESGSVGTDAAADSHDRALDAERSR